MVGADPLRAHLRAQGDVAAGSVRVHDRGGRARVSRALARPRIHPGHRTDDSARQRRSGAGAVRRRDGGDRRAVRAEGGRHTRPRRDHARAEQEPGAAGVGIRHARAGREVGAGLELRRAAPVRVRRGDQRLRDVPAGPADRARGIRAVHAAAVRRQPAVGPDAGPAAGEPPRGPGHHRQPLPRLPGAAGDADRRGAGAGRRDRSAGGDRGGAEGARPGAVRRLRGGQRPAAPQYARRRVHDPRPLQSPASLGQFPWTVQGDRPGQRGAENSALQQGACSSTTPRSTRWRCRTRSASASRRSASTTSPPRCR
jgi:hypothetical protein